MRNLPNPEQIIIMSNSQGIGERAVIPFIDARDAGDAYAALLDLAHELQKKYKSRTKPAQ